MLGIVIDYIRRQILSQTPCHPHFLRIDGR